MPAFMRTRSYVDSSCLGDLDIAESIVQGEYPPTLEVCSFKQKMWMFFSDKMPVFS